MKRIYTTTDLVRIGVCAVLAPVAAFLAIGTPGLRWPALFVAGCLATFLAVPLLERRQQRREQVTFDDKTIRRVMRRGGVETIAWHEVDEIQIITTDEGPGQDDVFWLLLNHDSSRGCAVSNEAEGFPALLAALQQLPGFDNAAVVRAMGSATNQRFTVWKRASAEPLPPPGS
jgi:hypothetical protein